MDACRGSSESQVDVVVGIPVLLVDEHLFPVGVPQQIALGQRRSLVGAMRLITDQRDPPGETLLAQGLRSRGAGQAGTDDDKARGGGGHWSELLSWKGNSVGTCGEALRREREELGSRARVVTQ